MRQWLKRVNFQLGDLLIIIGSLGMTSSSIWIGSQDESRFGHIVSTFEAFCSIIVILMIIVSLGYRDGISKKDTQ